jgi:hypothetical protein
VADPAVDVEERWTGLAFLPDRPFGSKGAERWQLWTKGAIFSMPWIDNGKRTVPVGLARTK